MVVDIDGAFFGTSFPHIFLMTYENCVPSAPSSAFIPRVFGFKIHPSSSSMPKQVVVLDGASYSNAEASSDELNFASSVEGGPVASQSRSNGGSNNTAKVPVVFDLTNDSAANVGTGTVDAGGPPPAPSSSRSNSGSTTLEAQSSFPGPTPAAAAHTTAYGPDFSVEQFYDRDGRVDGSVMPSARRSVSNTTAAAAALTGSPAAQQWHYVQNTSHSSDGFNNHHLDVAAASVSQEYSAVVGTARSTQEGELESPGGKRQRV
jgi:hypothetical protein